MKVRVLLFAASVLLSALVPSTASAQFACGGGPGPGMRMVGFSQGGNGIAPVALCVYEDNYEDSNRSGPQGRAAGPDLSALSAALSADIKKLASDFNTLVKDPQYQKYREGFWQYYQEGVPPKPGKGCSATFANFQGILSLSSAPDDKQPVVYSFSGLDVPRPKTMTPVKVTFHQSSGQDMSIPAMNFTAPGADIGSIGVMIKDMRSALRSLQDSEDLAIDLDGKRIYTLSYHGGKETKAAVEQCMAKRG